MRIVREFKCEMTGDVCLILVDKRGDEMCILKEDYLEKKLKKSCQKIWQLEEEKS